MTPASLPLVSPSPVAAAPASAPAQPARGDEAAPPANGFARQLEQQREQRQQHGRAHAARQATARQELQAAQRQRDQATPAAPRAETSDAAQKTRGNADETAHGDEPPNTEASATPLPGATPAAPTPVAAPTDPLIALALRRAGAGGESTTPGEAARTADDEAQTDAVDTADANVNAGAARRGHAQGASLGAGALAAAQGAAPGAHDGAASRDATPREGADFAAQLQAASDPVAAAAAPAPGITAEPAALPQATAAPEAALPLAAPTDSAPAPASAEVPVPVTHPGFGAALGQRLAVLARDGVQEARLSLHPADMGPVTVQIVLEGTAARIDFQAARGDTCGAIEQALPTLAGALREAGLTLAGGGVFQQGGGQGGRQSDGAAAGRGRGTAREAQAPVEAAAAPVRARRGVVDLVA